MKPEPDLQADTPVAAVDNVAMQLHTLYADRQRLFRALGTADAGQIISMVRSLEAQLADLYAERAEAFAAASAEP